MALRRRQADALWVGAEGGAWPVRRRGVEEAEQAQADGDLRAPMPGQVLLVPATAGQTVSAGDPVVVLESMKMELVMTAPVDGVVAELSVAVGDRVVVDQTLGPSGDGRHEGSRNRGSRPAARNSRPTWPPITSSWMTCAHSSSESLPEVASGRASAT